MTMHTMRKFLSPQRAQREQGSGHCASAANGRARIPTDAPPCRASGSTRSTYMAAQTTLSRHAYDVRQLDSSRGMGRAAFGAVCSCTQPLIARSPHLPRLSLVRTCEPVASPRPHSHHRAPGCRSRRLPALPIVPSGHSLRVFALACPHVTNPLDLLSHARSLIHTRHTHRRHRTTHTHTQDDS